MQDKIEKFNKLKRVKTLKKQKVLKKAELPQRIKSKDLYAMLEADQAMLDKQEDVSGLILLYQYLPAIFPDNQIIKRLLINNKRIDKVFNGSRKALIAEFLPYHVCDEEWLILYVQNVMQQQVPHVNINIETITNFVKKSPNFKNALDAFKQRFIHEKIVHQMTYRKELKDLPIDRGYLDFADKWACDRLFRDHLRAWFIKLGFDYYNVQIGIESNAKLWRRKAMEQTFENLFNNCIYFKPDGKLAKAEQMLLNRVKQIYKKAWLQVREYEYYQYNKQFVDECGTRTPAMKMSPEQLKRLKNIILWLDGSTYKLTNFISEHKCKKLELHQKSDETTVILGK